MLALNGSIGSTHKHMGEELKALSFYEKKHEVLQSPVSPNQISQVPSNSHEKLGATTHGLLFDSKVSKIARIRQAPPPMDLATSYGDMGLLYYSIGEYSKAFKFFERAISIGQSTLPSNHPNLHGWMKNLDRVRKKL